MGPPQGFLGGHGGVVPWEDSLRWVRVHLEPSPGGVVVGKVGLYSPHPRRKLYLLLFFPFSFHDGAPLFTPLYPDPHTSRSSPPHFGRRKGVRDACHTTTTTTVGAATVGGGRVCVPCTDRAPGSGAGSTSPTRPPGGPVARQPPTRPGPRGGRPGPSVRPHPPVHRPSHSPVRLRRLGSRPTLVGGTPGGGQTGDGTPVQREFGSIQI